jgi:hypothetical protein
MMRRMSTVEGGTIRRRIRRFYETSKVLYHFETSKVLYHGRGLARARQAAASPHGRVYNFLPIIFLDDHSIRTLFLL